MTPTEDFADKANSFLPINEFKRDLSDPAIPYEETHQPDKTNALRDFLAGVLCALAVGLPLTAVYLWRTGGL